MTKKSDAKDLKLDDAIVQLFLKKNEKKQTFYFVDV